VHAPWFHAPQKLLDVIEQEPDGSFRLLGRSLDLIDVAGKRASLADLTQRLLAIDGVQDGVFIQPDSGDGLVRRLAAFVVAPGLSTADVRSQLERAVDPVFSPRPLVFVEALPRNATGKLPRQALLALLAEHERVNRRD
jgi:acyl-coenzyme A synthetase/AMP-(fatty) acid ligase